MTKKEFLIPMKILTSAFSKETTHEQLSVWYEFVKDETKENFEKAIRRIVTSKKYFPSIAEVREEIALLKNSDLQLDANEEWQEVLKAIRKYDLYDGEKAISTLKPYTQKIVKMIGWYRICSSQEIIWEKKEFIKLFNEGLGKSKVIEQMGEALTYKEQALLEEKEIDKENLLEMEN